MRLPGYFGSSSGSDSSRERSPPKVDPMWSTRSSREAVREDDLPPSYTHAMLNPSTFSQTAATSSMLRGNPSSVMQPVSHEQYSSPPLHTISSGRNSRPGTRQGPASSASTTLALSSLSLLPVAYATCPASPIESDIRRAEKSRRGSVGYDKSKPSLKWKGKGKHRPKLLDLPPSILLQIFENVLARAFEDSSWSGTRSAASSPIRTRGPVFEELMGAAISSSSTGNGYAMGVRTLRSVCRTFRHLATRETLTHVYITTSRDLQAYEAVVDAWIGDSDDGNTPSSSSSASSDQDNSRAPLSPRSLLRSLTIHIGGQRYNHANERSILNLVTLVDVSRLFGVNTRSSEDFVLLPSYSSRSEKSNYGDPRVSDYGSRSPRIKSKVGRNLECLRFEFGKGCGGYSNFVSTNRVTTTSSTYQSRSPGSKQWWDGILGALNKMRRLKCIVVRCHGSEGICRETGPTSQTHRHSSHQLPFTSQTPTGPHLFPSLTHITLGCSSHQLAKALVGASPNLRHLRIGGAWTILQETEGLRLRARELTRSQHRDPYEGKIDEGLRSVTLELRNGRRECEAWGIREAIELGGLLRSAEPFPHPSSRASMTGLKPDPSGKGSKMAFCRRVPKTIYLENVPSLTLRWRGDLDIVGSVCEEWGIRLVWPPPPGYVASQ